KHCGQCGRAGAGHAGSCPVLQRLAACATTPAWTPCQAPERTPGLSASRAESWWGPQRRRCATELVVLLGWCDHPGGEELCGSWYKAPHPTPLPEGEGISKAAQALAVLHQAFGEHGMYRPVKGFETLVNVCVGMHAREDAAAARHQVHTPHLYGLTEAVLDCGRNVFQRLSIEPGDGPRPKVDVEGRRLPVDTGGNFLPVDDVVQALAQALRHAVGLGLHRAGGDDAQGRIPCGRTVGIGVERATMRDALEAVMLGITGLRHHLHDRVLASHGPTRQAPCEDFREGAQVGHNPQCLLQTARTPAESR